MIVVNTTLSRVDAQVGNTVLNLFEARLGVLDRNTVPYVPPAWKAAHAHHIRDTFPVHPRCEQMEAALKGGGASSRLVYCFQFAERGVCAKGDGVGSFVLSRVYC